MVVLRVMGEDRMPHFKGPKALHSYLDYLKVLKARS